PSSDGSTFLGKVAGHRAEERVLSVLVPIDAEPPRGRIGDLDEGELGDPEGTHLDVHEDDRIAIVARGAELDTRPALLGRRVDPEEAMPDLIEACRPVDPEAGADVRGDEPPVEGLAQRLRQPVQLLEGAELQGAAGPRIPQSSASSLSG